ncbi:MAG TPA: DNA polymerase III subunit alpha [Fimbriimonadaceae bacterium]|jgi:error-prone DNA polymerase
MLQGGRKLIARWREAGEWWSNEPYIEVRRFQDERGIRKQEEVVLPTLGLCSAATHESGDKQDSPEDQSEEWTLKKQKRRDEKVSYAAGSYKASLDSEDIETTPAENDAQSNSNPHSKIDIQKSKICGGVAIGPVATSDSTKIKHLEIDIQKSKIPGAMSKEPQRLATPKKTSYAQLHATSGYSFGHSCMLADEIPILAAHANISAIALTDKFSLVGCVEFAKQAAKCGVKPLVGATIEMEDGGELVLIAKTKQGYENLSKLITACHLEEYRLFPLCNWERLSRFSDGLICLTAGDRGSLNRLLIRHEYKEAKTFAEKLINLFGLGNVFIEIEKSFLPWEISVNELLLQLASKLNLKPVAGGLVTHARRDHFPVQDIMVCAETLCMVDEIVGRKPIRHPLQQQIQERPERGLNAERFLRTADEMEFLFIDHPELLANTLYVADLCEPDVLPARTQLPKLYSDEAYVLRHFTQIGASLRHKKVPKKLKQRIESELERICRLNFAGHFLVAHDACRWASEQDIQFSGRGSVVDSAVAYCLGLSRIDAFTHDLHFDRFLPQDGSKRPDIDIDFEARHRDKIRNYLTNKYGVDHVATVAAVGAYCTRGIVREVGKALGLPNELIGFLAKRIHGGVSPHHLEEALEKRPELRGSSVPKERFQWVFKLAERLMDLPRNMRAHSSGVIISARPLAETVPVMWSASPSGDEEGQDDGLRIIQWDKRSAKYYFDKFDILCLRGQDVLSGTQVRVRQNNLDFNVSELPMNDEHTYSAMRSGELIGIPQSASPAMRQAHIRLRTQNLHDASLVQAGIRPGVGGAVKLNELIGRRRGTIPYSFSHPELERILGITYGITVFQEQVDQLLQSFCGFSSGEAEDTREAIHKRRREDYGLMMKEKLINHMVSRGHGIALAEEAFELIAGFKGYGFAQGHALAFAEISIRSIHCQQNFPAEYFAALLSAQPAGYYGPCTIVNEARSRGVAILPPDVNSSELEFSVESVKSDMDPKFVFPGGGIRVGLNQVMGISNETKEAIVGNREELLSLCTPAQPHAIAQRKGSLKSLARNSISSLSFVREDGTWNSGRKGGFVKSSVNLSPNPLPSQGAGEGARKNTFYSFFDFVAKVRPERDELEKLILAGCLDSLHPNRKELLWSIPAAQKYAEACIPTGGLPLQMPEPNLCENIDDFTPEEKMLYERMYLDLDVKEHLMAYERERVTARGGITSAAAKHLKNGEKAIVVGNPIRLRFPPTPSGKRVVFFDLEDETGLLNVTCFDAVYQRDGHAIVCSPYVTLIGEGQDRDGHIAFLAHRVFPYQPLIGKNRTKDEPLPITTGDFLVG